MTSAELSEAQKLILAFAAPSVAQDINAGIEAYQRGGDAVALGIFRPLAEQGDAQAQVSLGVMYEEGWGVAQDNAEAERWMRLAAEQGNAKAQDILGFMYFDGRGMSLNYVQAFMWWSIAASHGQKRAAGARDVVANMMTAEQVAEAQRLAREWAPN